MEKQTFENYQDYLNSEKWKQVKDDFTKNYLSSGWRNVCEVTGEIFKKARIIVDFLLKEVSKRGI